MIQGDRVKAFPRDPTICSGHSVTATGIQRHLTNLRRPGLRGASRNQLDRCRVEAENWEDWCLRMDPQGSRTGVQPAGPRGGKRKSLREEALPQQGWQHSLLRAEALQV